MYVYKQTKTLGDSIFTVGYFAPDAPRQVGGWLPESDHNNIEDAIARVSFLNGGSPPKPRTPRHRGTDCHTKAELEVHECNECGLHIGIDATYLEQVGKLTFECLNCGMPCTAEGAS